MEFRRVLFRSSLRPRGFSGRRAETRCDRRRPARAASADRLTRLVRFRRCAPRRRDQGRLVRRRQVCPDDTGGAPSYRWLTSTGGGSMGKFTRIAIALGIGIAGALALGGDATGAARSTLQLRAQFQQATTLDLGAPGRSIGDEQVASGV